MSACMLTFSHLIGLSGICHTFINLFHGIDPNWEQAPHNIHDMEIVYYQNGDYEWGQYMAEQVNKHPHDVKGRLLGYSSNLSLVLK